MHRDVCEQIDTPSVGGARYFVMMYSDYFAVQIVGIINTKDQTADIVKNVMIELESESKHWTGVRRVRMENGKEFV